MADAHAKDEEELEVEDRSKDYGNEKRLLGPFFEQAYYLGNGAGNTIIVEKEPRIPYVDVSSKSFRYYRSHEQLLIRDGQTGQDEVAHEAYNYFGSLSITPDGKKAAAVLDLRQRGKSMVLIDLETGAATPILTHRSHYPSGPTLSPDGEWVAFWYRTCRRGCSSRFEVMKVDGSERRVLVEGFDYMRAPLWGADSRTIYVAYNPDGGAHSLWSYDVQTADGQPLLGEAAEPLEEEPVDAPEADEAKDDADPEAAGAEDAEATADDSEAEGASAGQDGEEDKDVVAEEVDEEADAKSVPPEVYDIAMAPDYTWIAMAVESPDGRFIGRYDIKTKEYKRLTMAKCKDLAVSPDGERIAFETWGDIRDEDPNSYDKEVALLDVKTGEVTYLTVNSERDDLGGWSRDGKHVYFSQYGDHGEYGNLSHVFAVTP